MDLTNTVDSSPIRRTEISNGQNLPDQVAFSHLYQHSSSKPQNVKSIQLGPSSEPLSEIGRNDTIVATSANHLRKSIDSVSATSLEKFMLKDSFQRRNSIGECPETNNAILEQPCRRISIESNSLYFNNTSSSNAFTEQSCRRTSIESNPSYYNATSWSSPQSNDKPQLQNVVPNNPQIYQPKPKIQENEVTTIPPDFDLAVEDTMLQASFRHLAALSDSRVTELEQFYMTHSAAIVTQRADAICRLESATGDSSRTGWYIVFTSTYSNQINYALYIDIYIYIYLL